MFITPVIADENIHDSH